MALKAVKALLTDEIRLQRFQLAQYVEIQLVEDFLSPGHSLYMPSKINQELVSSYNLNKLNKLNRGTILK